MALGIFFLFSALSIFVSGDGGASSFNSFDFSTTFEISSSLLLGF